MEDKLTKLQQELEQVRREKDLYWRILGLGAHNDLQRLLEEALSLIVDVTHAQKGYLAIFGNGDDKHPRFAIAHSCSEEELEDIRQKMSRGIIAQAMATGKTIHIDSAQNDPRFQENTSVMAHEIQAVLCTPIGADEPLGVLYLQDREDAGSFSQEDRLRAETFSRHLAPWLDRLFAREREREAEDLTLPLRKRLRLDGLIGKSRALFEVFRQVESAARFDVSVLLTGPSGTGKTALARAIHDNSPRAKKPFLELNCAALPEALFESELFGALPGAHSTATRRIYGKLAAAAGGTLFLDEIGELSLATQSKLLQFLQSKEYFPLGSNRPEKAEARLITATNKDLREAVAQKKFRDDLYYRLKVMTLRVPSLAERKEDIQVLCRYFCQKTCQKYGIPELTLSGAALRSAEEADWPGNVRELAHAIESATIRASVEESSALEVHHLFQEDRGPASGPLKFQEATRKFQRRFLLEALEATQWNLSETARRLGLARSHIHNLLAAFELRHLDPRKK